MRHVGHLPRIPEDGVLTPKHVAVILILILHCLFVDILV